MVKIERFLLSMLFGLCCTTESQDEKKVLEKRFFIVERRDKNTLMPIIKREVANGSIIHSDEWAAYRTIGQVNGYIHETVNHQVNFVDPDTGAHTQTIECIWRLVKARYGVHFNGASPLLERQLQEEWWRSVNSNDIYNAFLRDMLLTIEPAHS